MKIPDAMVQGWINRADAFCQSKGVVRSDVVVGREAWDVAHHLGFTNEAYKDRTVVDAHIQTALERVFPNVVFKDPKRY